MVLNSSGSMGELVVLGWLALELTNSPFLVGAALGARTVPLFFVGLLAGAVADRFPRHRLLMATASAQAATAASMGMLVLLGWIGLGLLVLLTMASGVARAIEQAARQSYTHDVIGPAELVNGMTLLGVAMRVGWLGGSLGAGVAIARGGSGLAYLAVAAAYLAGGFALV